MYDTTCLLPAVRQFRSSCWKIGRTGAAALLCAALLLAGGSPAFAQKDDDGIQASVTEHTVTTSDGWQISLTYYQSTLGKKASVVVLLHGEGENRLVWQNGFAQQLQKMGYCVAAVDLRRHGQSANAPGETGAAAASRGSLSANDYQAMAASDLEAVKDFLLAQHQKGLLNVRKMAIVASEMSAPVAISYATLDWAKRPYPDAADLASRTPRGQDIRAVALLSPDENLPGLPTGRALLTLRNPAFNIAFLLCYGSKDRKAGREVKQIYNKLTGIAGNDDRMYSRPFANQLQGTKLLGRGLKVEETIIGFLQKHVAQQDIPWRDRRSRLEQ